MSNPSKNTDSSPLPGDDRNVVAAGSPGTDVSIEDNIRAFWIKNSRFILMVVALGFLVIVGREVITYMWKQRELGISEAYGAADNTEKLKAFAAENSSHKLAGFAWLRIADEAYTARNYTDAAAAYEKAAPILKDTPMAGRSRIGAALSRSLGGDRAKGDAELKALSTDLSVMQALRSEARYHLATLAIADGKTDEARTQLEEIMGTDLSGMWAQRAYLLSASLPGGVSNVPTADPVPASEGISELKLNLPGNP